MSLSYEDHAHADDRAEDRDAGVVDHDRSTDPDPGAVLGEEEVAEAAETADDRDGRRRPEGHREDPGLTLWNLHDGVCAVSDAQRIFNVLGHLDDPTAELTYALNGAAARPVHVLSERVGASRTHRVGDFSIDTILCSDLRPENRLVLTVRGAGREPASRILRFTARPVPTTFPGLGEAADGTVHAEELGQIVDGRWRLTREDGEPVLRILPRDAGYDRIILLGLPEPPSYEISARIAVDEWLSASHNIGLVFDWYGHDSGDGSCLPREWTTGLAYYASSGEGLRLRVGARVRTTPSGGRIGSVVLDETPMSRWRHRATRSLRAMGIGRWYLPQLRAGVTYDVRLRVRQGHHALTVWRAGAPEPGPQVGARVPRLLMPGAAGLIAFNCAVRVHEFEVSQG